MATAVLSRSFRRGTSCAWQDGLAGCLNLGASWQNLRPSGGQWLRGWVNQKGAMTMILRRLALGLMVLGLSSGIALAADKEKEKPKPPPSPDPTLTECTVPFRPAVVLDGATATDEQIQALAVKIRRYQEQLGNYRACLEPSLNAAKDVDLAKYNDLIKQYNDSVAAEEEVVAAYQKVLAAYKAASKSPAKV